MAIITISRGSYSRGKEVAEKAARRLGYACISREIVLDASEIFNVPELKLARAIHDAPSLLDRFSSGKERYIAFVEAALLRFFQEDNVVYHGLAGHFFVQGIGHALKVRITADMPERVRLEMAREGLSEKEALERLQQDDEERRRWSQWLYGIDTADPKLYDLVINLKRLEADDAVELICRAALLERFRATEESLQEVRDRALAAELRAALMEISPEVEVRAERGRVRIAAKTRSPLSERFKEDLAARAAKVPGVASVEVQVEPIRGLSD